jgi:hypothetical protein
VACYAQPYTALVRPILEYGAVCWDRHREGQVSALNGVQNREAKFARNTNETGWETLAQHRRTAQICTGLESDRGQTSKTMLSE